MKRRTTIAAALAMLIGVFAIPVAPVSAQTGKVRLLWLGQSAFRITTPSGKVIVIDPYLTNNPTTPAAYKDLDALGKIDLILVSHAHYDHFEDAPALSRKHDVPMYGPAGLNQALLIWVSCHCGWCRDSTKVAPLPHFPASR